MSWQDPVALVLAVLLLWGARALARHLRPKAGHCAKCPAVTQSAGPGTASPTEPTRVRLDQLRLGRPRR